MYTRSPAAYEALSSFHLLQLPSAGTLKTYTRSNVEASGEVEERLAGERAKYDTRIAEHIAASRPYPPLRKGTLIFDEVKVVAKLHWNSRDDRLVGHAMTSEEMATLNDLYEVLESDPEAEKADYVLQTLWQDLSSDCDIVGPYYTGSGPFKAKASLLVLWKHYGSFKLMGLMSVF